MKRRESASCGLPSRTSQGERGVQLDVDDAEEIRLTYPDGPHDAEALFVDPVSGDLFIVHEGEGAGTAVYGRAAEICGQAGRRQADSGRQAGRGRSVGRGDFA